MGPEFKYSRRRNGKLSHQFTLAEQLEFQLENLKQILKDTSMLEIYTSYLHDNEIPHFLGALRFHFNYFLKEYG